MTQHIMHARTNEHQGAEDEEDDAVGLEEVAAEQAAERVDTEEAACRALRRAHLTHETLASLAETHLDAAAAQTQPHNVLPEAERQMWTFPPRAIDTRCHSGN